MRTPTGRPVFQPRVITAAVFGTTVEWYDFALYATAASLVFNKLYFPGSDPLVGTIAAFGTFAIGFLGRPLGGAYFGELGDRKGRKHVLVLTLLLMGIATTGIGLLPTYGSIGAWAPLLLVALRFAQGFAAGGEKTGALILLFENAPPKWRGLLSSLPAIGTGAGTLLSTGAMAIASTTLSQQEFLDWGWRIPFLLSAVLTLLGLWVRRSLDETEEFQEELERRAHEAPQPPATRRPWRERLAQSRFAEAWRRYPREMIIVICAGAAENTGYYVFGTFSVAYAENAGLVTAPLLTGIMVVSVVKLVSVPLFGALSDRWGRRPVSIFGALVMAAACYPFFRMVDTEQYWVTCLALVLTLGIGQSAVLGSQPAFFAELFTTKVRFTAVGVANNLGTVLTGGLAPLAASALLLWFDRSALGVVGLLLATCAITVVTVALARETREPPRRPVPAPGTHP
ncbi:MULTISPECIES: MFS transporter [unclassified Saccharopolyspora]|uniref:MFS transporter n=1 Tax=unclassified Saccharopolyspora TaxID=2646250 RepID=UPI001CD6CA62|nr:MULTISPECIES: MFS transporter [unclassified Saccharopolyspora]MCA1192773.1 MHS family MFS transporter [Saccharopolyspora sp. 6V]MCA1225389.1 MHS family MFS transporter [Saccharopolyspora sp. 6M]